MHIYSYNDGKTSKLKSYIWTYSGVFEKQDVILGLS